MIASIKMSTSSGNTLGYDLGDKKDKDQRVRITAWEGVLISPSDIRILNQSWKEGDDKAKQTVKGIATRVAGSIAKQFDSQASVNTRVKNNTGHLMISHEPSDMARINELAKEWNVSPEAVRTRIDYEFMKRMGLTDTQYVIIQHKDTHCPHDHIAYNRVQYDGTVVDSSHYKLRCQRIAAEISEKYGLTVATPGLRKGQRQDESLKKEVSAALSLSTSLDAFKVKLAEKGIDILPAHHSNGDVYGIAFKRGEEPPIPGSRLGLSYGKVASKIETNRKALSLRRFHPANAGSGSVGVSDTSGYKDEDEVLEQIKLGLR